MFFAADVEVAVHLRSFRNISVRQPCQLMLKLSVSHHDELGNGKVLARPVALQKCSLVAGVRRYDTTDEYSRSILQKDCYRSKCISVRYQDESVGLDDLVIFQTKINVYPCERLKQTKLTIEVELEQARSSFVVARYPTDIGKSTTEVKLQGAQRIQPFFDVFMFGSAVDAVVYTRLKSMEFVDNMEDLQRMVERHTQRMRMSHIEQAEPLLLPMHFKSFEDFLAFAINDGSKQEVQKFYDSYVQKLRHELIDLKQIATDYLSGLDEKGDIQILNMSLVKKLSARLPQPNHLKRKQRKSIFNGKDNADVRLSTESNSFESCSMSMFRSGIFSPSNKISDFRLSPQALAECISKDIEELGKTIEQLWREFLQFITLYPNPKFMEGLRLEQTVNQLKTYITHNIGVEGSRQRRPLGKCQTQFLFNSKEELSRLLNPIHPPLGPHAVILVHGFQAYSNDMERISSYLKLYYPSLLVYCASSNEGSSKDKIETMGQRLAVEIKNFVNSLPGRVSISFICHSMGGLVVRAALPYLSFYKNCMQSLVSVCSPHTGYVFHTSMLVKTGLWVMNKMQSSDCLKEMCCEDTPEPSNKVLISPTQKHFLQQLAEAEGLQWFKNVVLIASREDEYVSYSSARLQKDPQCTGSSQQSKSYSAMLQLLQQKLSRTNLSRIRVQFCKSEPTFNSFIGRAAHIQLLTDRESIRMLVSVIGELFSPRA